MFGEDREMSSTVSAEFKCMALTYSRLAVLRFGWLKKHCKKPDFLPRRNLD